MFCLHTVILLKFLLITSAILKTALDDNRPSACRTTFQIKQTCFKAGVLCDNFHLGDLFLKTLWTPTQQQNPNEMAEWNILKS